jgi:hypothetical protein
MPITPGSDIEAEDFIDESERDATPANDEGKVAKLEANGEISPVFHSPIIRAIAGQSLSLRESVYIASGVSITNATDSLTETQTLDDSDFEVSSNGQSQPSQLAQVITVPPAPDLGPGLINFQTAIISVIGRARRQGTGTGTIPVYGARIVAVSGGVPTGTVLVDWTSRTSGGSMGQNNSNFTVVFVYPPIVSVGMQYAIAASNTSGGSIAGGVQVFLRYQDSNEYAGGHAFTTTNGGSNWTALTGADAYFHVTYEYRYRRVAGRAYKTQFGSFSESYDVQRHAGFVSKAAGDGEEVEIQTARVMTGFSGLTPGAKYYISGTAGGITTGTGTARFVGVALSATTLLIQR